MKGLKETILASVQNDLEDIERALTKNLKPYLPLVSHVASYIMFSGGKRMRPLLMVLTARLCGYKGDYDKTLSVVFEYLHAATLLHDDLVDGADVRRGNPVEEIIKSAEEHNCDLIVMGTHGQGTLADVMLGSTARRVIRRSKIPVLVVRLPEA